MVRDALMPHCTAFKIKEANNVSFVDNSETYGISPPSSALLVQPLGQTCAKLFRVATTPFRVDRLRQSIEVLAHLIPIGLNPRHEFPMVLWFAVGIPDVPQTQILI